MCGIHLMGKSKVRLPSSSDSKEPGCNAGDPGSTPGLGRFLGERKGYPLQYSCLKNPMNRGAWQATVCGVPQSRTQLRDNTSLRR